MPNPNPAIVIPCHDRPASLRRLLTSLSSAIYPNNGVALFISVDPSENLSELKQIADSFSWRFGQKEVIIQNRHLGLREHVLYCGDLTDQFDTIILLEDDLYVSPFFYSYTKVAQSIYSPDEVIAGISLYSQSYNETARLAFAPLDDGYENFFLQLPSSWGQSWTRCQWLSFRSWYDRNHASGILDTDDLPGNVTQWPDSSWKKFFIKYMMAEQKFFVYPRISLTTNFMDPGTHHKTTYNHLQVPLRSVPLTRGFSMLEESNATYDAFCELLPDGLRKISPYFAALDREFVVDLYGTKRVDADRSTYVVTSRQSGDPIRTWGLRLKPHECNLIYEIDGDDLCLTQAARCQNGEKHDFFALANYYHSLSPQAYAMQFQSGTNAPCRDSQSPSVQSTVVGQRSIGLSTSESAHDYHSSLVHDTAMRKRQISLSTRLLDLTRPIRARFAIWRSGLFFPRYYYRLYPAVAEAGINPLSHYLKVGADQGFNPNPLFDSQWYRERNPELTALNINPLYHYIKRGAGEGQDPSPSFSTTRYLRRFPGLSESGENPLVHYFSVGIIEDPSAPFRELAELPANHNG